MKTSKLNKTTFTKAKIQRLPDAEITVESIPWKTAPQITPQQIQ